MNLKSKVKILNNQSSGFTILELLIATVVFSVVLLLCATAIVQVGRMYYKTTLLVRVTDTARAVSDDVSQAIQFGMVTNGFYRTGGVAGGVQSVCLGSIRYTFAPPSASLGTGAGQMRHTLWKDRGGAGPCTPVNLMVNTPSALGQELLGNDMRVSLLDIRQGTKLDGSPDPAGIWTINIIIAYGSGNDLFVPASNYRTCVESIVGGQFCAVSSINTNATKRL